MNKKQALLRSTASSAPKKRFGGLTAADLAAAAVFAALTVYLIYCAKYGVQNADESAYYTFSHRLFSGDAPLVHEWSMTALSFPFQYLPLQLYYILTGSMEGCILFMRYLFVAVKMLLGEGQPARHEHLDVFAHKGGRAEIRQERQG